MGIVGAGSIQLNISASVHRPGSATSQSPREDNEAITLLCSTKDKKPERPHCATSTEKLALARLCLCLDITTTLSAAIFQRATWKSSSPAPSHAMMSVIEGSEAAGGATHTRSRQGLPLLTHTSSRANPAPLGHQHHIGGLRSPGSGMHKSYTPVASTHCRQLRPCRVLARYALS